MKNLIGIVLVAFLAACGGGEPTVPEATIPLPSRLASPVSGDTEVVLHVYQALYGKAPSNPQLITFRSQIAAIGAGAWANSMATSFNSFSNIAFATRVLNNISITETSLAATATFGSPKQAYDGLLGGFVDYLNLVGAANRGIVAAQLTKIISNLEVDTQFGVYGPAAISLNRQVLVNSAYSQDPKNIEDGVVPKATANAGMPQSVVAGAIVTLDGSASSAEVGRTLTFFWTLTSRPAGSTAAISGATSARPTFTADVAGTYTASLVVNDGTVSSTTATVSVTATATNSVPLANAGSAIRFVVGGSVVVLDGSLSSDSTNRTLSYVWTMTSKPLGSIATLTGSTTAKPNFVADVAGVYGFTLIVNNGSANSAPAKIEVWSGPWVSILAGAPAGSFDASGFLDGRFTAARFARPHGVTLDGNGNILVSDSGNEVIRKITPDGVVQTIVGNGQRGFQNGVATEAKFYSPTGLVLDSLGNLFVADTGNNVIRKVTAAGVVSTFAGNGSWGFINGTAARFAAPSGIAIDKNSNVYVADSGNNAIRKITPNGVVSTFAGNGAKGFVNGVGVAANFSSPSGLAFDSLGNLYVADSGNHAIRKITPDGIVSTYAGTGSSGFTNGTGTVNVAFDPSAAKFSSPAGVTIDAIGNLFVTDSSNNAIRKITPARLVSTVAGGSVADGSLSFGYVNGFGTQAKFNSPQGIVVNSSNGLLYIADFGNYAMRRIEP